MRWSNTNHTLPPSLSSRTTSRWTNCAGSCRQSKPSTASAAWPGTSDPMAPPAPWTTSPSPAPSTERATYKQSCFSSPPPIPSSQLLLFLLCGESDLNPFHCPSILSVFPLSNLNFLPFPLNMPKKHCPETGRGEGFAQTLEAVFGPALRVPFKSQECAGYCTELCKQHTYTIPAFRRR